MNVSRSSKYLLISALIAFGVLSRVVPHAWNFTPMIAVGLFVAAYFGLRTSFVAVMIMSLISDFFIGFYAWPVMLAVYGSYSLAILIGSYLKPKTPGLILMASLSSSLLFFLITNWAVWQFGTLYMHSLSGLVAAYTLALPFFRNSLAGDIFYSGVLFGSFSMLKRLVPMVQFKDRASPPIY